jgi:hypothetical protein
VKKVLLVLVTAMLLPAFAAAAGVHEIVGTWSGNWMPKGGSLDAVTVELREDTAGKLTGKFLTPTPMDFSEASFNPATKAIAFEATNAKTGKLYRVDGKIKGTELIGTFVANDMTGEVRLIKWTFFGS